MRCHVANPDEHLTTEVRAADGEDSRHGRTAIRPSVEQCLMKWCDGFLIKLMITRWQECNVKNKLTKDVRHSPMTPANLCCDLLTSATLTDASRLLRCHWLLLALSVGGTMEHLGLSSLHVVTGPDMPAEFCQNWSRLMTFLTFFLCEGKIDKNKMFTLTTTTLQYVYISRKEKQNNCKVPYTGA